MEKETTTTAQPKAGWRFRLGLLLFVLGGVCPIFIPLVAATGLSATWKTTISGLLALGIPELLWLAAAAVMGKSGFNRLKARFFGFFKKHGPPQVVSRARYYIGLVMFLIPIFLGWLAPYVPHLIPGYGAHRIVYGAGGDIMLLVSLFVLGGEFWDKLRTLFIHQARTQQPGHDSV